jgi:hypothetical protein
MTYHGHAQRGAVFAVAILVMMILALCGSDDPSVRLKLAGLRGYC